VLLTILVDSLPLARLRLGAAWQRSLCYNYYIPSNLLLEIYPSPPNPYPATETTRKHQNPKSSGCVPGNQSIEIPEHIYPCISPSKQSGKVPSNQSSRSTVVWQPPGLPTLRIKRPLGAQDWPQLPKSTITVPGNSACTLCEKRLRRAPGPPRYAAIGRQKDGEGFSFQPS
jgi:hypothetical protein